MAKDPRDILTVQKVVSELERIGGHAKNIAGHVIFLLTAHDVRHESLATISAEVLTNQ